MAAKYPRRVVLGVGWPCGGTYDDGPAMVAIALQDRPSDGCFKSLDRVPEVVWSKDAPEYRLVLERVGAKKKGGR